MEIHSGKDVFTTYRGDLISYFSPAVYDRLKRGYAGAAEGYNYIELP